jgi:hypothetical protein
LIRAARNIAIIGAMLGLLMAMSGCSTLLGIEDLTGPGSDAGVDATRDSSAAPVATSTSVQALSTAPVTATAPDDLGP